MAKEKYCEEPHIWIEERKQEVELCLHWVCSFSTESNIWLWLHLSEHSENV